MRQLHSSLVAKANDFAEIIKIGRTHTQDATPLTLGQEFGGYAYQVEQGIKRAESALPNIYALAQGGTAVGTGLNTKVGFAEGVWPPTTLQPTMPWSRCPAPSARSPQVYSRSPMTFASSSASRGLGELILPANEPGSSIMPGKVNPTQAEALTMVCAHVIGNDAVGGGQSGPLRAECLQAHDVLQRAPVDAIARRPASAFTTKCVDGIQADEERISKLMWDSLMLVTALAPEIGYDNATTVAKTAHKNGTTLREEAIRLGFVDGETFDRVVQPGDMIGPKA